MTAQPSRLVHYSMAHNVTLCGAVDPCQSSNLQEVTCPACLRKVNANYGPRLHSLDDEQLATRVADLGDQIAQLARDPNKGAFGPEVVDAVRALTRTIEEFHGKPLTSMPSSTTRYG